MLLNELIKEEVKIYGNQGAVAKQIGISQELLSKALNAWKHDYPSEKTQKAISKYFNCDVEYLTSLDVINQKEVKHDN